MKIKKFILVFIILYSSTYLSAQQWRVGGFINGGYSTGINAEQPELIYETLGKGSIAHGLSIECEFKKYSFQLEFNRLNIGYTSKSLAGFSDENDIIRLPTRHPVFFNTKFNYNYTQFGFKAFYILIPKVKVGLGIHPSKINKESIRLQNIATVAGKQPGPTVVLGVNSAFRDYENFQPYNLFISANFRYQIWKYISINTNYIISTFPYNGDEYQFWIGRSYHQAIYGGLEFSYPF